MCKSFPLSAQQDILLLNVYLSFFDLELQRSTSAHNISFFDVVLKRPPSVTPLCNVSVFDVALWCHPPLQHLIFWCHAAATPLYNPPLWHLIFWCHAAATPPLCDISFIDISCGTLPSATSHLLTLQCSPFSIVSVFDKTDLAHVQWGQSSWWFPTIKIDLCLWCRVLATLRFHRFITVQSVKFDFWILPKRLSNQQVCTHLAL